MRTVSLPSRRAGAVAAASVVLVTGLLSACSAGTPSTAPASAALSAAPSGAGSSSGAVRHLTLVVKGDSVTGDTGTVDLKRGEPVELTVTSDVADEVHVHGVDIGKDVAAGGTVVIDFTQTAPGRFEIELEHRKRTLTRLQVS